jgi:hypothetical protein
MEKNMKKCLVLSFLLLSGLSDLLAESLCGSADTTVCMTSSRVYEINCQSSSFGPGSTILLKVPGLETAQGHYASGEATVPYWFSDPNGNVTDSLGNTWSVATSDFADTRGNRIITFELQNGALTGTAIVNLNEITVCQKVSDGPGQVLLTIEFWLNVNNKTSQLTAQIPMDDSYFEECTDYQGYLPSTQPGDEVTLVNPWDEPVLVDIGSQKSNTLNSFEQRTIPGGTLTQISSSRQLGLVVRSMEDDLNLVTILAKDTSAYLIPHLSNNPESWVNQWRLASGSPSQIQYQIFGSEVQTTAVTPGLSAITIETVPHQANAWLRLNSSRPTNGYFTFTRIDGISGGAAVNALRPVSKPFGSTLLNISHVAADQAHFWTGFSLVNPNEQTADVQLTGYRKDGSLFSRESLSLKPGEKTVEVIGNHYFQNYEGLSWVQIQSDVPLAGLELFGGTSEQQPYLAGFLLSSETGSRISFPLVQVQQGWWSGISLLNPGNTSASGNLTCLDSQGMILQTIPITLESRQKHLILAPEGCTQALWKGDPCTAFLLTGDDGRQKLGGYLGMIMAP